MNGFYIPIVLAIKFISRHRRKSLATGSFITVGTAILVILNGITAGINETMVKNTTHLHSGHILIDLKNVPLTPEKAEHSFSKLDGNPNIRTFLYRQQLTALMTRENRSSPITVFKVDPDKESDTTAIKKSIIQGRYLTAKQPEIIIGSGIAKTLDIRAGETVQLYPDINASFVPFQVSGVYHTGIRHYDDGIGYISEWKQAVVDNGSLQSHIAVFLKDHRMSKSEMESIKHLFPEHTKLTSWDRLMPDLVQLIEMNGASMNIIMVLVFILVGFGISNTFILTIVDRYKEFGVLKAMGFNPKELIRMIFLESFMICLVATSGGLILGWLITEVTAINGIDFSRFTSHNQYFVLTSIVTPKLESMDMIKPAFLSMGVSMISSYLPARLAGKKIAAEMLRFA